MSWWFLPYKVMSAEEWLTLKEHRSEPRSTWTPSRFPRSLRNGLDQWIRSNERKYIVPSDILILSTDPLGGFSGSHGQIWNAVILTFEPGAYIYTISNRSLIYLFDRQREEGTFKLLLNFGESYPDNPPTVKYLSMMFHHDVYANGELCSDILQNRWSPTYDIVAILTNIQSSLLDRDPNSRMLRLRRGEGRNKGRWAARKES